MTTTIQSSEVQTPLCDVTFDQLAVEIKREHEAAGYRFRESLNHARAAGVRLLEVKSRLAHGEYMPWVKAHCGFSQSTANLYAKLAKGWGALGNSQQVANLSLRDASALLYMDPTDEHADAAGQLVNLGLLDWCDLDGLEPLETRALVTEVRQVYEDLCFEVDEGVEAQRAAMPDAWDPPLTLNRFAIRSDARRVATDLKTGKIGKGQVRGRLRRVEAIQATHKTTERPTDSKERKTSPPSRSPTIVQHISPFQTYVERTRRFIDDTRALLTEPHGLLDERVTLSAVQRGQLAKLIASVRGALDALEEGAKPFA
jgi:hypothetical protein